MEKENGKFKTMESKLHQVSLRQKSKVSRTRLPQRFEYVETTSSIPEYRNSVKKSHPINEYESQGMNSVSLHLLADTDENKEWQRLIGQRVCISGVKPGILRYFGRTNFAQGYWCGVELDEPVGKHNGTVNGVIYFNCKPNHGIFAPVSKVSKLNDLSACSWQADAIPQRQQDSHYSHSSWDYNVGFTSNSQELKFIKNSASDPTSLKPRIRSSMPHSSQSFTYDERSVIDKRRSESMNAKAFRNFEVSDLSPRHTKSFSAGSTFNILHNSSSSHSLNKYACDRSGQYLSSNLVRMSENSSNVEQMRGLYQTGAAQNLTSTVKGAKEVHSLSTALEEFQQYLKSSNDPGQISPISETKNSKDRAFFDNSKIPDSYFNTFSSFDYPSMGEEMDNDDQMSIEYDESLGILTPSQMKDFTLCPDFPTSSSEIKGVEFPSSESFDDINELPEDEQLHDVSVQYVSESSNRNIEITKQTHSSKYSNNFMMSSDDKKVDRILSTTDKFLSSISQKRFNVDSCPVTSLSNSNVVEYNRTTKISSDATTVYSRSPCDLEKELNVKQNVSKSFPCPQTMELKSRNIESVQNSFNSSEVSTFDQYSTLSEQNKMEHSLPENSNYNLSNEIKISNKLEDFSEELCGKIYDTDSSRDSLMHTETESVALKEKLTVSWEDCMPHNNSTLTVERPESVYTVASTDTGFQEDGEIELETGMATSMESTDSTKRFSMASRDSCIVADDIDSYKIAESNSTSGYSTGLSDSCCNDRPEDDLSSKPITEELQDSVGPCDSEDGFSFQEHSLSKDSEMMIAEVSDVTVEAVTALCNDSTSDHLCETMVEDTTLTEINELLSPEETKSSNISDQMENCDSPMEQPKEAVSETKDKTVSDKAPSSVSTGSPAQSTPERKVNRNRPKIETQRNQSSTLNKTTRTSRAYDEESDKRKQIAKSPKKNVMSKIKAMIEATSCKNGNKVKTEINENATKRTVSAPKRSRWDAVTSKIAASLAEEKTKPKTRRDIRSRVDTNLTSVRQQVTACKSPRLDSPRNSNCGDGTLTPVSVSSRERKPLAERNSVSNLTKEVRAVMLKEAKQDIKNPRPGKHGSRPSSPVAASESSATSVSLNSHNSRSKIAHWKGSTSTIASSIPPLAPTAPLKRQTITTAPSKTNTSISRTTVNSRPIAKKPITVPKIRVTPATNTNSSVRMRSPSPANSSKLERSAKHSRTSREQTGVRGSLHASAKQPVRPPMWLSKAELTAEIQRLGTLCEARTKELNRLKMETKHVSVGFDAFAALFKYMVEDLDGLSVPMLSKDLQKTLKQLELAKQDLAYYEREVEEMKAHHSQELNDLSNKLFEVYQGEITELSAKHQEELNQLNYGHQQQMETLSATLQASSDEVEAKHAVLIGELQQELITQREELQLFQEREIKDLEEKHALATKTLQEHIEQLQKKCAELNQHSASMESAMRNDTDSKLQWVTSRKIDLEKEVESLKAVLEMKNKELHTLRVQTLEMEKQLEELPLAREKIKMLQARAEDLEALMIEKTKVERKLSTENHVIKETYEKESKVNKRLSMENEELQWRLRQAETSILSGSFAEVSEYPEDVENGTTSPLKTPPAPQQMSRSVFFTFIDKEDACQSPRSQYKKITPGFSTNYKTSPARTAAAAPSPRRAKSNSEPPQPILSGTPRKASKHKSTTKRPRSGSECTRSTSEHPEVTFSSVAGSMASSVSSESSVFEHKEQLLEEHEEQILETLQILREQRSVESPSEEPATSPAVEKEWCNGDSKPETVSPDFETADMSRSSEFSDPKTYYHMTFPVPKETGIVDCDTEYNSKNTSEGTTPSVEEPAETHSISDSQVPDCSSDPNVVLNGKTENVSTPGDVDVLDKSEVLLDMPSTHTTTNTEAQDQQETV